MAVMKYQKPKSYYIFETDKKVEFQYNPITNKFYSGGKEYEGGF